MTSFDTNDFPYHFSKYLSYYMYSVAHREFMLNVSMKYEPSFYHQVVPFVHWRKAMADELASMERLTLGASFYYLLINILLEVNGYIMLSIRLMKLLTDTRHA